MKLLFALILLPLIEIVLFIQIGGYIGVIPTLIVIVLSAVVGANLLRHQSFSIVQKMREHHLNQLQMPEELFGEFCKFSGAILLIIPGFLTDLMGALLYIPACQRFLYRNSATSTKSRGERAHSAETIIDVEYIEIDESDEDSSSKKQ